MGQDLQPQSVQMYDPYEDADVDEFPEAGRKSSVDPMEHAKNITNIPLAFHDPQPIVDAKGNHPEAEWASALEPDIHESDPDIPTPVPAAAKEDVQSAKAGSGFFGGKLHMPHLRHPHLPGRLPHGTDTSRTGNVAERSTPTDQHTALSGPDRGFVAAASENGERHEGLIGAIRRRSLEVAYCLQPEHGKPKNEMVGLWPEHRGDTTLEHPQGR
ncbi:hypothetical protein B0A48_08114 [Cryoendolithus antarcticus]|uniref:Uncharacterized protein n=1 Tax=Cryoendolithus antarcticus TaxID=1507870 RepID=A0A1V8T186_9PEZI|nr:hypothetical protein B0A48_08114 [Cryoendolithus antarcticus]